MNEWDQKTALLVEVIYDSLDRRDGWRPMLGAVVNEFDSVGAYAFLHRHTTGEFLEECICPGQVFYENIELCKEAMRRADSRLRLSRRLTIPGDLHGGFVLLRPESAGGFEREHIERLEFVMPHLLRALRLGRRMRSLEREADHVAAALDRLPTAALIVSRSLEIFCVNRQASELLERTEALRVRRGQLVPRRAVEASALREAVLGAHVRSGSAIETLVGSPNVVGISRPEKLPLDVLAVPLRPRYRMRQNTGHNARVMLMIYDPESRPTINPVLIERLFDLTPTEGFIAARLAEGRSIAEVAKERRCSASTVRTHVKHIFQKTRTNRQGELVQLLLTSPAISFAG